MSDDYEKAGRMVLLRLRTGAPDAKEWEETDFWYETYEEVIEIATRIRQRVALRLGGYVTYGPIHHQSGERECVVVRMDRHDDNLYVWTRLLFVATGSYVG